MGKRKEIKFMCRDGRTFEGRQDGVLFWIRENQILRRRGLPCYYVAANDTKGKGRTVFTGDHEHFTLGTVILTRSPRCWLIWTV